MTIRTTRALAGVLTIGVGLLQAQSLTPTPALPPITQPPPSVAYQWKNVVIRAGGFVTGIVFSSAKKGLVYARTDVGGAYRSDDAGAHWVSLSDSVSREDATYLGIESIAVDQHDANKLYIAAGMYSAEWGGPSAILRSNDKGQTFDRTPMPFKMGGNDNGRGCGERLAVDPNLGSILYFGSRKAGLWKSVDSGVTWSHVDSFPADDKLTGVGENTGITFVLFDDSKGVRGQPTKTIYAGSAQPGANLYRSDDGGVTWQLVDGRPKTLFPTHAVLDRGNALYFSFDDNIGPNGITDGAVWKYTLADGKWKDISPVKPGLNGQRKFGFGGLAIDAEHPQTLMVTTIDRWGPEDTMFRTTDGGKSWKDAGVTAQSSAINTPWVYWHRDKTGGRGWMSDIKIDPFDSAKVLYTTGEGIWGSADMTAFDAGKPTHWGFPDDGIEETVPLSLISPPVGVHLLSGVGDIGGFRHEDLQQSPKDGFFLDPWLISTTSLDFAALVPATIVRVGHGDAKVPRAGYSVDDGEHWKPFASEPPSSKKGGGKVAIAADEKTVVWTPDNGAPYWTADWGKTWTACNGLSDNLRVVSDRVNPARFYSFNTETGQLFESADGARTFEVRTDPVAAKGRAVVLAPTPGVEGDLWIAAGDKVYHSTDAGDTFVTLEGADRVYKLGFGMAAPGKQTPSIYMNGLLASSEGTFRSDDGGKSWVKIDDPAHQFGWKNDITGDPRIFGRVYLATGGRGIVYGEPVASPGKTSLNAAAKSVGPHTAP